MPPAGVGTKERKHPYLPPPAHPPHIHAHVHTHARVPASLHSCLFNTHPHVHRYPPPHQLTRAHTHPLAITHTSSHTCSSPVMPLCVWGSSTPLSTAKHSDAHPHLLPSHGPPSIPSYTYTEGFLICFVALEPQKYAEE